MTPRLELALIAVGLCVALYAGCKLYTGSAVLHGPTHTAPVIEGTRPDDDDAGVER